MCGWRCATVRTQRTQLADDVFLGFRFKSFQMKISFKARIAYELKPSAWTRADDVGLKWKNGKKLWNFLLQKLENLLRFFHDAHGVERALNGDRRWTFCNPLVLAVCALLYCCHKRYFTHGIFPWNCFCCMCGSCAHACRHRHRCLRRRRRRCCWHHRSRENFDPRRWNKSKPCDIIYRLAVWTRSTLHWIACVYSTLYVCVCLWLANVVIVVLTCQRKRQPNCVNGASLVTLRKMWIWNEFNVQDK